MALKKKEEDEELEEPETPKPRKEVKEPRILVVKEIPKVEIREATLEEEEVECETIEEALTAIRNDIKEMKKSLTG